MKNIIKFNLFVVAILLFVSCYKDKGNYEYTYEDVDVIRIDTANLGIKSTYDLALGGNIKISPNVFYKGQIIENIDQYKDKLSFKWTTYQDFSAGKIYPLDTLSQDIHFDNVITRPAGAWNLKFTVTNLETNTDTYIKFKIIIDEPIPDGWMVLYEKNGYSDVALIIDERVKSNVLENRILYDLIKLANGESLLGKPRTITYPQSSGLPRDNRIVIVTDKNMIGVHKSTFENTLSFDKFFFFSPDRYDVTAYTNFQSKDFIINNNRLHSLDLSTIFTSVGRDVAKFGLPIGNDQIRLAAWQPIRYQSSYDGLVYDELGKRFLKATTNSLAFTRFTPTPNAAFDTDNVGLDLVTYDWGRGLIPLPAGAFTGHEYLIMKNASDTYLLSGNFNNAVDATVPQRKVSMTTAPGIATVNSMTAAVLGQYILYSNPEKVYLFDYGSVPVGTSELWSAPSGEIITDISIFKSQQFLFHTNAQLSPISLNQYVYFATWNEASQNGKIYCYKIDISNGSIEKSTERVYEGFGKIKQMIYKWNLPGS